MKKIYFIVVLLLLSVFVTNAQDPLIVSGISNATATGANGTYELIPTPPGVTGPVYKHQSASYYLYYDQYGTPSEFYWNIDNNTNDDDFIYFFSGPFIGLDPKTPPQNYEPLDPSITDEPTVSALAIPEIHLLGNSIEITDGDLIPAWHDFTKFGSANLVGETAERTFIIKNAGSDDLEITSINFGGVAAGDFSITPALTLPLTIVASGETTFTVSFDPSVLGDRSATITIVSNDSDEGSYDYAINGWGYSSSDISMTGVSCDATANGLYNHQGVLNGFEYWKHESLDFYIYNEDLIWYIDEDLTDASAFFFSDDHSDDPSPLNVSVWQVETCAGTPVLSAFSVADINVLGNSLSITDGDDTPSFDDHTRFGAVNINQESLVRTYTLQNTGSTDLEITAVGLTRTDAALFSLSALVLPATVAGGSSITVDVTFDPDVEGDHNATLEITSDDPDETTYNFDVNAWGYVRSGINVSGITSPPAANGAYDHEGVINGFQYWKHSTLNYYIYNSGSEWFIDADTDDATALFFANNHSTEHNPLGVTGWSEEDGAGTPVFNSFEYDIEPPVAVCRDTTVYLDNSGNAVITASEINDGSTDNIGITSMSLDVSSFVCSDVGTPVTVTLTLADDEGNSSTCPATVTVLDTISPTAVCKNIDAFLDASGNVTITAADIDGGSSDNCSGLTFSVSQSDFTCDDIGANNVKLFVSDVSGNKDSCDAVVTVIDNFAPSAVCQEINVYLDETGNASIVAADIDGGSSDNCSAVNISVSQTNFTCDDIGPNNVTLTVIDDYGNTSTCVTIVTVVDDILPTIVCKDDTIYLDVAGQAPFNVFVENTIVSRSDNCTLRGSVGVTGPGTYTCDYLGDNTVTIFQQDLSSNQSSSTITLTVLDTIAPTAVCKNTDAFLDASGNVTIAGADIDNGSSDNCSGLTFSVSQTDFTCDDIGVNNVKLFVTDASGNKDSCEAVVNVVDNVAPTAVCKNINAYLDEAGNASIVAADIDGGSSDNCGSPVTLSIPPTSFTCADIGPHNVTLTVTDDYGNTATCVAVVTVVDDIPPVLVCQDVTIELDENGNSGFNVFVDNALVSRTDNCGLGQTFRTGPSIFTCDYLGENTITIYQNDINGNTTTSSITLTITDPFSSCNAPPVALCQNITVQADNSCLGNAAAEDFDNGSTDPDGDQLTYSVSPAGPYSIGTTPVILTVSDGLLSSTCEAMVTVIDNIAPTARCKNRTISLEDNGLETISASAIDNNSWDACGIRSISIKPNSFSKSDIGVNTVVLTVVDNSGNVSTCKSTVTVIDITPPSVVCNTADFVIVSNGQYEFTQADIDALAAGTSDNVNAFADLVISVEPMVLTCDNVGGTTVTVYASDEAGNTDSCTVQVGVTALSAELGLDSIQDVMVDEDTTLIVSLTGITGNVCTAENPILTASSDNSDLINSLTVNYTSGNTNAAIDVDLLANESGIATITVVLEDGNGNEVAESFMLTVKPVNDSPVLVTELQDMEMKTNETLTLELSKVLGVLFDDVDDLTLVYSLTFDGGELPVWVTAMEDDNALTLGFEPLLSDTGCYNIVVEAEDMMGEIASSSFELCVSPVIVGINDLDETLFEVTMYPNPTKGQVTIKHEIAFAREVEVAVMNIAGSEVFRKKYFSSDPIQFDLSDEVSGMYIVNIKIDEHHFIRKLILDRK